MRVGRSSRSGRCPSARRGVAGTTRRSRGCAPAPGRAARELRDRFESGAAAFVPAPEDLGDALGAVTPRVEAPVPTLVRESGEGTVVFVPAAYPRATEIRVDGDPDDSFSWARGLSYTFDAGRYRDHVQVVVRGV